MHLTWGGQRSQEVSAARVALWAYLLCLHACCHSLWAQLASCLTASSGKVTSCGALCVYPRTCIRTCMHWKNRNWHKKMKVSSSWLTQGVSTPSLKGIGLEPKIRSAPRARTPQIRLLTSLPSNSFEKGWSGKLGPGYIHMVISHQQSGWTWRMTKAHRRSAPISPPRSSCWMTSRRGCCLWMCFWATPYYHLGWGAGWLPMNTESGATALFLKKNHTFRLWHRVGHWKAKVGIKSRPISHKDVHTTQHHCFRVWALL
jgi:hypothetical protein